MPENVIIAYRGANYAIGQGPLFYGIWHAAAPQGQPLEWWPLTPEGWTAAWARFASLEVPGTIAPVTQQPVFQQPVFQQPVTQQQPMTAGTASQEPAATATMPGPDPARTTRTSRIAAGTAWPRRRARHRRPVPCPTSPAPASPRRRPTWYRT